jgi:hypothetical protein
MNGACYGPASQVDKTFTIPRKPVSSERDDSQKTLLGSEVVIGQLANNNDIHSIDETGHPQVPAWERSMTLIWSIEIVSLVLALVAFVAIIITLFVHQNRPLPHWPSLISINTLIAIFTAIMRASMLLPVAEGISQLKWLWFHHAHPLIDLEGFDLASRGPWGCLLLLLKHPKSKLTALGALVTIIAMATDPFTQQVIEYRYCSAKIEDFGASIARTNNYTYDENQEAARLSAAMSAALYTGLISPPANASSGIRVDCPSGNCTFLATSGGISYVSLSMCSSCTNITNEIIVFDIKSDSYYLPADPTVGRRSNLSITQNQFSNTQTLTLDSNRPPVESTIANSILTFEMLMQMQTASSQVWASRCSLTPCVKSYGANVTNGILEEHELPEMSVPLQLFSIPSTSYYGIFTNATVLNGQALGCKPSRYPTKRNTLEIYEFNTWIPDLPGHVLNDSNTVGQFYPPECGFLLGPPATNGIIHTLAGMFDGEQISCSGDSCVGEPWMVQLVNDGALTPSSLAIQVGGLANAISVALRNGGDPFNSAPARGTALVAQTCIHVRWPWLALPASLLLLSSLFLISTMLQTRPPGNQVGKAWKSSPLALLFHGFSNEDQRNMGRFDSVGVMNKKAKAMRVQLIWGEQGWKFRDVVEEKDSAWTS